jgi:hypothetical protein
MEDFILVEWGGGKRKLYRAICSTCGKDRGYKKPKALIGNCKSCQKKIQAGTLGIVKKCIQCDRTEVPNPAKNWHAGPTCCYCYGKKYRKTHRAEIRSTIDAWRQDNLEQHKASEKQWRKDNKDQKDATDKAWQEANKEHFRKLQNQYVKNRLKTDSCFKLAKALRHRVNEALITGQKKGGSAVRDLGCSIEEFKAHLESKFHPNPETGEMMTWENHTVRGWHIDHIKPLISFDLTDRVQFLEAAHYTNQQPLWWRDNIRKGDK